MKDLSKVMANIQTGNFEREKPAHQKSDQAGKIINDLFDQLKTIKPAWRLSFTDESEENNAKKEWYKAFVENEVNTVNKIKVGMAEARKDPNPYWPSVGQFIKWCDGAEVNTDELFDAMLRGREPTHAAELHTRMNTALTYDIKHVLDAKRARKAFKDEYLKNLELERKGEITFVVVERIEQKANIFYTAEQKELKRKELEGMGIKPRGSLAGLKSAHRGK